jgi:hypothetical protein
MEQSKLQTYASIGEIISVVAIVISLVYAGYEFRPSGTLSNRDAETLLYERFREMKQMEIQTPGMAEVLIASVPDSASLSPGDRRRVETF